MKTIEESELKEINALRVSLASVVSETGQYALRVDLLKADIADLTDKLSKNAVEFKRLLDLEDTLIKRLSEKYGTGTINFETGEFIAEK
jgi:hypothetical protein